jgi:hypothetical protein
MKFSVLIHKLAYLGAIGVSIMIFFFIIGCTWIGYEVKSNCRDAKSQYEGDCVEALTALVQDENRGYSERNSAIWALGQLGDSRALPVLEGYYTGDIPEREPLDGTISQYELKKAIHLARGGTNIGAPFWRFGIEN